jgi:thiol:disulfide interchange protein DsbC
MKKVFLILLLLFIYKAPNLAISSDLISKCKKSLKANYPGTTINNITLSPIKGVCELQAGSNIYYYFPQKNKKGLMIIGEVFNEKGKNITEKRRQEVLQDLLKEVPFKYAIKKGSGPVQVILFTDPDCPYCRKLEKRFKKEENLFKKITLYTFLNPLPNHTTAPEKVRWILCQADKNKAISDVFIEGKLDKIDEITYPNDCKVSEVERRIKYSKNTAEKINVNSVPYIMVNGRHISKGMPEALFKQIDLELKRDKKNEE